MYMHLVGYTQIQEASRGMQFNWHSLDTASKSYCYIATATYLIIIHIATGCSYLLKSRKKYFS